jgi:glycyl-tRNA synthetase
MRAKLPFGIAAQGKVFRNEITPGNFIFRTREFDLMEFEYFVKREEWEEMFEYWRQQMHAWIKHLGVAAEHVHEVEIPDGERAHYSQRTIDFEYDYPFGQKELYGLAYRTDFDLRRHMEATKSDWGDVPHVIEPTFGLDRSVLVTLLEAYHIEQVEGETRVVLQLPTWAAPVQVAVLPLSKKDELSTPVHKLAEQLSQHFRVEYDETQSIGKRYRRQDEIGTPFCVTFDFDSLNDEQVTVRERDSMQQERIPLAKLISYLQEKVSHV